ncbi:regulatory LuxR family protein [Solirubrobacter pauli]|uniref:Regulatory LuxR family protein n=1 Tax=Solirubrobacter pauli TaxID=166793 RepID=A0A660L1Q7_9ACTN|nr:AAA family ATPase [Solirubrobacter pauli]RKQ86859.1 regulatory LuxR family protein [Solirubrobacter pauli]
MLLGRDREGAMLKGLLDDARRGRGGALVVRGESGAGKTALLDEAAHVAGTARVVRAVGVEQERELPFAGLHQLCAPLVAYLDRLPRPRRDALAIALGLRDGPAPREFLVSVAALGLLTEAAADRPLLCLVDDVQWLDRASTEVLGFIARRLADQRIAIVVAVEGAEHTRELHSLPELHVSGLDRADARALLRSAVVGRIDERVIGRLTAETGGRPGALLEACRELSAAELAGGFAVPRTTPPPEPETDLDALPTPTRYLLLIAAAEPVGDAQVVWRAAAHEGIGPEAATAAAGLAEFNGYVRFRHPRLRAAVYATASPEARSAVHRALAAVTDADADADMRAWHLALATAGPADAVADELERSVTRAHARGGLAAAGAFFERATALTSDPARRVVRALAAARTLQRAGEVDSVVEMLAVAEAGPLTTFQQAEADVMRARIGNGDDAAAQLQAIARRLEPLDARFARGCYLEAWVRAESDGARAAIAADAGPASAQQPETVGELLLHGLAQRWTDGFAAGVPAHRRAIDAFVERRVTLDEELDWLPLVSRVAAELWDYEAFDVLSERQRQLGQDTGALAMLPDALDARASARVLAGDPSGARAALRDLRLRSGAVHQRTAGYGALVHAAWRGDDRDVETVLASERRDGGADWAAALIGNARGEYEEALDAAERAVGTPFKPWALPELVEAGVRAGEHARAAEALAELKAITGAVATDWATGVQALATAVMSDGPAAEVHYRVAIARLARARVLPMLARAKLLYGEALRRERRRRDARAMLLDAHSQFVGMDARAFAERSAQELRATGSTARQRGTQAGDGLTEREWQIAQCASDGMTNAEIGTRLYISPRTVEYHLSKIFAKLGISSRAQLAGALPEEALEPVHAH